MFDAFVTPGTDTKSSLSHIVPAFLYHQLFQLLCKKADPAHDGNGAAGVSTPDYVMISAATGSPGAVIEVPRQAAQIEITGRVRHAIARC
jgi:hypothetical protein